MQEHSDMYRKALSLLRAFEAGVDRLQCSENEVREYHEILDRFESLGEDTSQFRIPLGSLKARLQASQQISETLQRWTGPPKPDVYSNLKYADQHTMQAKVHASYDYFKSRTSSEDAATQRPANSVASNSPQVSRVESVLDAGPWLTRVLVAIKRSFGLASAIWFGLGLVVGFLLGLVIS